MHGLLNEFEMPFSFLLPIFKTGHNHDERKLISLSFWTFYFTVYNIVWNRKVLMCLREKDYLSACCTGLGVWDFLLFSPDDNWFCEQSWVFLLCDFVCGYIFFLEVPSLASLWLWLLLLKLESLIIDRKPPLLKLYGDTARQSIHKKPASQRWMKYQYWKCLFALKKKKRTKKWRRERTKKKKKNEYQHNLIQQNLQQICFPAFVH